MKTKIVILLLSVMLGAAFAQAQIVAPPAESFNTDSVRRAFDKQPYFGLYKDNYFIFGPPIGHKPTAANTNVKFQISISQRLTKSTLPWGTYLYLFYTQKVFWNVLQNSMPMTDLNFNPGIGLAKPLFVRNRYIGKAFMVLEHESNGRDSIDSRSWNRLSFGANIMITPNVLVHGKFWIPIVDGQNNQNSTKYAGIYQFGFQWMSDDRRFNASITTVRRAKWNPFDMNTILEFGVRLFKNDNQYLFFQYYNGYGEGLLDYKQFHSQFRVGLQIKPRLFSDF